MKLMIALIMTAMLSGCAAALVPETSDPAAKLGWARELFQNQNRPIPAERLIKESLDIYKERNDGLGEAEAYRAYGEFYKSAAYGEYVHKDQEKFSRRYNTAMDYYGKSRDLFVKNEEYFGASNTTLQIGFLQAETGNLAEACRLFDKSLEYHELGLKLHPDTKIKVPEEFTSFEDGIAHFKARAECKE